MINITDYLIIAEEYSFINNLFAIFLYIFILVFIGYNFNHISNINFMFSFLLFLNNFGILAYLVIYVKNFKIDSLIKKYLILSFSLSGVSSALSWINIIKHNDKKLENRLWPFIESPKIYNNRILINRFLMNSHVLFVPINLLIILILSYFGNSALLTLYITPVIISFISGILLKLFIGK